MQETWVRSLGGEDPPEKEMATHSSMLAWEIPWTEESGRLQSIVAQEMEMTLQLNHYCLPTRIGQMVRIDIYMSSFLRHLPQAPLPSVSILTDCFYTCCGDLNLYLCVFWFLWFFTQNCSLNEADWLLKKKTQNSVWDHRYVSRKRWQWDRGTLRIWAICICNLFEPLGHFDEVFLSMLDFLTWWVR